MIYRFDEFEIDTQNYRLSKNGTTIKVEPKVFDLLSYLVVNRDKLVTRDELFENIWSGRIVSDTSLSVQIKAARKAIGDTGQKQLFIRTVHGRGYQFVAPLEEIEDGKKGEVGSRKITQESNSRPSIAILPFTNMSSDPEQEFFSDGISEDIIAELSRFHTLFVIARNSSFQYKGKNVSVQEVGRALAVQYIVEGSVRRYGNRIRVIAQLVETETENQIWSERYDRELGDLFEVQDEVTRSIVAVLPGRIQEDVVDRAARKPTEDMKAYELMLQGKAYRDLLSAEGNAAARRCCQKAIELDPRYARAYMYLSDSYIVDIWLGLAESNAPGLAMQYALDAVRLDNNDVYIQDHLGFAHLCSGLWREAEVQFDKTLAKIVNEAESMAWCGYAYLLMGELTKARTVVLEAIRLDPLHPPTLDWILAQICYFEGKYEEVIDLMYGNTLLNSLAYAFVTAAHAHLGHHESTQISLQTFITERRQEFKSRGIKISEDTVETLSGAYRVMWRDPKSWSRLADGLRLAGLPD